ncbi:MAG TPA: tetratricopeptide repeat protein [Bryobacteraceae bacterium]|nr:tetratricopeptide repeat protein [Bryobacteraceae bacterium]
MKRLILTGVLGLAAGMTLPLAQAQKGLVVNTKSQGESQAVIALMQAQQAGPDAEIKAAEDLITKYSDTYYKETALVIEANAYQQKGDQARAQVYGEQVLKVNPKNFQVPNMLGTLIVQQTHEHDLDRDDKLASAQKYFNLTLDDLKSAEKPNKQMSDEQWTQAKKYLTAEAHNGLGLVELDKKSFDSAIAEFKSATDDAPDEPAFQVRLASAYMQGGKNAEAIAVCDKLLANPQLNAQIRQVAQNIKAASSAKK